MNAIKDFIIKQCYQYRLTLPSLIYLYKHIAFILAIALPFIAPKLGIDDNSKIFSHVIALLGLSFILSWVDKHSIMRVKASEKKIRELFEGFKISNLYLFPVSSKVGAKSTSFDLFYTPKSANGKTIDSIISNKKAPFKIERIR